MAARRKERRKGIPELPVNSFADIAFLLIVFFIVASTLARTRGVVTDIPAGEKSEKEDDKTTVVQLHADRITFNDTDVSMDALRKRLAELKLPQKEASERVVLLEATDDVAYQVYYAAMTAISAAGGSMAIVKGGDEK